MREEKAWCGLIEARTRVIRDDSIEGARPRTVRGNETRQSPEQRRELKLKATINAELRGGELVDLTGGS